MSDPDDIVLLTKLLCKHGGRLPRNLLPGLLELPTEQIDQILQDEPQKFPQVGDLVLARSALRICTKYLKNEQEEECDKLHLCRYYLQGKCWPYRRPPCRFSHDMLSDHNRLVLRAKKISRLNDEEIKVLLYQNDNQLLTEVCLKYLHDTCDLGKYCSRLHICRYFIRGECNYHPCRFSHDLLEYCSDLLLVRNRMSEVSVQNFQMLCTVKHNEHLQSLKMEPEKKNPAGQRGRGRPTNRNKEDSWDKSQNRSRGQAEERAGSKCQGRSRSRLTSKSLESLCSFADADDDDEPQKTVLAASPKVSTQTAEPDIGAVICLSNVWKHCKLGKLCPYLHYYLPYCWQINKGTGWEDISDMEEIERQFCDPKVDRISSLDSLTVRPGMPRIRRLSTVSSVDKPSEYVLTTEWLWYWKDEYGTWTQYGHPVNWRRNVKRVSADVSSSDLENKYLSDPTSVFYFTAGGQAYEINFQEMKQKNLQYKTEKDVRRRPRFLSFEDVKLLKGSTKSAAAAQSPQKSGAFPLKTDIYPSTWQAGAMPEIGCQKVLVSDTSREFSKIVSSFTKTVSGHVVKRVWRLQNPSLWQVFQWQKEQLKKVNQGRDVKEIQLFHGTEKAYVDAICNENFDWRICGTHGTVYGQGSYFARDASYSHDYSTLTPSGTRMMFVARVLVGDYVVGNSKMKRPPQRPGSTTRYYDSCVDNLFRPSIFVVFEKHQSYPEYLLEYEEEQNKFCVIF